MVILKDVDWGKIQDRQQLADTLGVPFLAPYCVDILPKQMCKMKGCNYPAVDRNYNKCVACNQRWFPSPTNDDGTENARKRGWGMYGEQFLRSVGNRTSSSNSCSCEQYYCEKIGYSTEGIFRFPPKEKDSMACGKALGLTVKRTQAMWKNLYKKGSKSCYIAPWHYHPQHRGRLANGNWYLRKMEIYVDAEGKKWSFPPPNYNVQEFIRTEIPVDDPNRPLPAWVRRYAAIQERNRKRRGCAETDAVGKAKSTETKPWKKARMSTGRKSDNCTPRAMQNTPSNASDSASSSSSSVTTSSARPGKRRGVVNELAEELQDKLRLTEGQLKSAYDHIETLEAALRKKDMDYSQLEYKCSLEKRGREEAVNSLEALRSKETYLCYEDLAPGGKLAKYVEAFTFFDDYETNDAFLEFINYTEGRAKGDGMCERLVRYSKVSMEARREYNLNLSEHTTPAHASAESATTTVNTEVTPAGGEGPGEANAVANVHTGDGEGVVGSETNVEDDSGVGTMSPVQNDEVGNEDLPPLEELPRTGTKTTGLEDEEVQPTKGAQELWNRCAAFSAMGLEKNSDSEVGQDSEDEIDAVPPSERLMATIDSFHQRRSESPTGNTGTGDTGTRSPTGDAVTQMMFHPVDDQDVNSHFSDVDADTRERMAEMRDDSTNTKETEPIANEDDTEVVERDNEEVVVVERANKEVLQRGGAGFQLLEIAIEAMNEEELPDKEKPLGPGRKRKLDWKTEWLVYNCYVVCNFSLKRIAALFHVSPTYVHNVIYAWANLLCTVLEKLFPTPTREQMLSAYPKSVLNKFGHANICMLLDATETYAEVASMKTVNSILYSAYKHNSTLKWLVGCDPIGITWAGSISDGYPGSISDPVATDVSNILDQVPFGCATEVDKGFQIENACAQRGIACIRPMKFMEGQKQQSKEDTALT